LSEDIVQPVLTLGSVHELAGKTWTWSVASGTVFADEWAAEMFDLKMHPNNAVASATNCVLFHCVYDATFGDTRGLRVRFASDRAGVGILNALMPTGTECVPLATLHVHVLPASSCTEPMVSTGCTMSSDRATFVSVRVLHPANASTPFSVYDSRYQMDGITSSGSL
ncbi:MAG: hypothetical protein EBZ60_09165, partial [Betaproteobacteria bacterium]|nr:hypothetical protein [Betaproteobacteria bacterium]